MGWEGGKGLWVGVEGVVCLSGLFRGGDLMEEDGVEREGVGEGGRWGLGFDLDETWEAVAVDVR